MKKTVVCLRIDVEIADGLGPENGNKFIIFTPDQRKKNKLAKRSKWQRWGHGYFGNDKWLIDAVCEAVRGHLEHKVRERDYRKRQIAYKKKQ